jgi:signal transduction histidine kinase
MPQSTSQINVTAVDALQPVNVFMIEDDKYYCEFVRRVLSTRKQPYFNLHSVSDVAEARHYLVHESPDVILLDLNLPDSRGLVSLKLIKEVADGCPIIILTSSESEQLGFQAVSQGAQDYLVKHQIGNESLVRSIRYAIQRRRSEEQSMRMAAIQDFVSTLAHDMSVPLVGTQNLLDGLLKGHLGNLNDNQREALTVMRKSTSDQLLLVERLIEIYRYEIGPELNRRILPMRQVLQDCVDNFNANGRTIVTRFEEVPDGCCVWGDLDALTTLFTNLLENAVKFSNGEEVEIKAEMVDYKLSIEVHNFGNTMPEEVKNGIFNKFWQGVPGKTYVAKTGLGLYLCQRIAQLHQGRIACESSEESGTTISVRLPVSGLLLK